MKNIRLSLLSSAEPQTYFTWFDKSIGYSSTIFPIEDPINWKDVKIEITRSERYKGLIRKTATNLQFVGNGAEILRALWRYAGYDAVCYLKIEYLYKTTQEYREFATVKLDFAGCLNMEGTEHTNYFEVAGMDSSISAMMDNNEDVEYAVPLTAETFAKTIEFPATTSPAEINLVTYGVSSANFPIAIYGGCWPTAKVEDDMIDNPVLVNTTAQVSTQTDGISPEVCIVYKPLSNLAINGEFSYNVFNNSGSNAHYILQLVLEDISDPTVAYIPLATIFERTVSSSGSVQSFNEGVNIDKIAVPITAPKRMVMRFFVIGVNLGFAIEVIGGKRIKITFNHEIAAFRFPAIGVYDTARYLVSKMTDGKAKLISPYLQQTNPDVDAVPKLAYLFSGDAIRGLNTSPYTYPAMKLTWKKFMQSLLSIYGLGMYINKDEVHIVKVDECFDNNLETANIGEVSSCKSTVANLLFNTIKVGYPDQTYGRVVGREEYNTNHEYKMPINAVKSELNLISDIRADKQGIVNTKVEKRQNSEVKSDNRSDNEPFIIEVEPFALNDTLKPKVYPGKAYDINTKQKIITDPGVHINLSFTPRRMFLRNYKYIFSTIYHKTETKAITFQATDKYAGLMSDIGVGNIKESDNIPVTPNAKRLFSPVIFTLTTDLKSSMLDQLAIRQGGFIIFTWKGLQKKGYIMQVAITPGLEMETELVLLCTPDTEY